MAPNILIIRDPDDNQAKVNADKWIGANAPVFLKPGHEIIHTPSPTPEQLAAKPAVILIPSLQYFFRVVEHDMDQRNFVILGTDVDTRGTALGANAVRRAVKAFSELLLSAKRVVESVTRENDALRAEAEKTKEAPAQNIPEAPPNGIISEVDNYPPVWCAEQPETQRWATGRIPKVGDEIDSTIDIHAALKFETEENCQVWIACNAPGWKATEHAFGDGPQETPAARWCRAATAQKEGREAALNGQPCPDDADKHFRYAYEHAHDPLPEGSFIVYPKCAAANQPGDPASASTSQDDAALPGVPESGGASGNVVDGVVVEAVGLKNVSLPPEPAPEKPAPSASALKAAAKKAAAKKGQ